MAGDLVVRLGLEGADRRGELRLRGGRLGCQWAGLNFEPAWDSVAPPLTLRGGALPVY